MNTKEKNAALLLHGAVEERERCVAVVEAEPEFPGDMPDDFFLAFRGAGVNRDKAAVFCRGIVKALKRNIKNRILRQQETESNGNQK